MDEEQNNPDETEIPTKASAELNKTEEPDKETEEPVTKDSVTPADKPLESVTQLTRIQESVHFLSRDENEDMIPKISGSGILTNVTEDDKSESSESLEGEERPAGILELVERIQSEDIEFVDETIEWPSDEEEENGFIPEYFVEYTEFTGPAKEELIEQYKQAQSEITALTVANIQLQTKILEFYRKKKLGAENKDMTIIEQSDQENKFQKYINVWYKLKQTYHEDEKVLTDTIGELKQFCHEEGAKTELDFEAYFRLLLDSLRNATHSQTGQKLPSQQIENLITKERQKCEDLRKARLINLALKSKVKKKENAIRSKEDVSGGHQMYDFEQLKIENQAYNEKIEERNEELTRFRRKIMNTIHTMAHMKEKVHFLTGENDDLQRNLANLETNLSQKREALSKIKQAKDKLREERHKFHQRSGLLGKKTMLQDFKTKQELVEILKAKLTQMQKQHVVLSSHLKIAKPQKNGNYDDKRITEKFCM